MEGYYRHKYGGIYKFMAEATLTDDKSDVIVYTHIYPFETKVYVRRKNEFEKSFTQLSHEALKIELAKPREELQAKIKLNKEQSTS